MQRRACARAFKTNRPRTWAAHTQDQTSMQPLLTDQRRGDRAYFDGHGEPVDECALISQIHLGLDPGDPACTCGHRSAAGRRRSNVRTCGGRACLSGAQRARPGRGSGSSSAKYVLGVGIRIRAVGHTARRAVRHVARALADRAPRQPARQGHQQRRHRECRESALDCTRNAVVRDASPRLPPAGSVKLPATRPVPQGFPRVPALLLAHCAGRIPAEDQACTAVMDVIKRAG